MAEAVVVAGIAAVVVEVEAVVGGLARTLLPSAEVVVATVATDSTQLITMTTSC